MSKSKVTTMAFSYVVLLGWILLTLAYSAGAKLAPVWKTPVDPGKSLCMPRAMIVDETHGSVIVACQQGLNSWVIWYDAASGLFKGETIFPLSSIVDLKLDGNRELLILCSQSQSLSMFSVTRFVHLTLMWQITYKIEGFLPSSLASQPGGSFWIVGSIVGEGDGAVQAIRFNLHDGDTLAVSKHLSGLNGLGFDGRSAAATVNGLAICGFNRVVYLNNQGSTVWNQTMPCASVIQKDISTRGRSKRSTFIVSNIRGPQGSTALIAEESGDILEMIATPGSASDVDGDILWLAGTRISGSAQRWSAVVSKVDMASMSMRRLFHERGSQEAVADLHAVRGRAYVIVSSFVRRWQQSTILSITSNHRSCSRGFAVDRTVLDGRIGLPCCIASYQNEMIIAYSGDGLFSFRETANSSSIVQTLDPLC